MANNRFEIVDLRHGDFNSTTGGESRACVGEYRTGARAERSCACNSALMASNCAGKGGEGVATRLASRSGPDAQCEALR
jgi:hypothetical protein